VATSGARPATSPSAIRCRGSRYNVNASDAKRTGRPGFRRRVATCESCHGLSPHPADNVVHIKLNDHMDRVACQSCHVPTFARGGVAIKVDWDWRTADETRDGEGYKLTEYTQGNGEHRAACKSFKGSFEYGENLEPEYHWFNGQMVYTTIDTEFDPSNEPLPINEIQGSVDDPGFRLWPFKRMHTIQPFDEGLNTLVYMHLWGQDDAAFWGNYNFGPAIEAGMSEERVPYSDDYGFVETVSFWPITHMVAPAEQAVHCGECHQRGGAAARPCRLLPARRRNGQPMAGHRRRRIDRRRPVGRARTRPVETVHARREELLMPIRKVMVYSRFERFWHWTQALLIFALAFSGLAVRGLHETIPFGAAVTVHTVCALALIVLWLFAIFWHLTTGAWRHYVPTARGLGQVARYYASGIFKGERHPYRTAFWRKHNPLQALTYLALKIFLFPAVWITGVAYLICAYWEDYSGAGEVLPWVAGIHTLAAFAILAFVIAHVYLLTTGGSFRDHVKPMITGYDEVELTPAEERYFEESHTVSMR